ncbi:hypothetical protein ACQ4PT_002405 [Festuca glaucescens]
MARREPCTPGAARASSEVAGVGDHGQVPDELRDGASRASSSRGCEGELGHGTERASRPGAARERSSRGGTGEVRHSRRGRPRRDAGADELRDGAARSSSSRGGEGELGHGVAGQALARGGRGRAQPQLESGDKIIMPPSALDRLASLHIEYPMLFEVRNTAAERTSHCGVLEFIAEEGMIYMPYWMMQNLLLQEGDMVFIKNATLPKGTYVKLQPHTTDFLDITNPKAILEKTLRNYSCLTTGDSIMVAYNNKKYYIDIVETKPTNAVPKKDAKEKEDPKKDEPKFSAFTGAAQAGMPYWLI